MIRVGRRKYVNGKPIDPKIEGFTKVISLTKSTKYGDLSPYELKTKKGYIMENVWQGCKVYRTVPKTTQRASRFDKTIIWQHEAETHLDENDETTEEYWNWREKLFNCPYPVRYPVGQKHRHRCEFAFSQYPEERLDYIQSRIKIYAPLYLQLVRNHPTLAKLKSMLTKGKNLLIIEVDGPHEESLEWYQKEYDVGEDFIEGDTILATKDNLSIMLHDTKHPFGHGYCLAMALKGWRVRELI